MSTRANVTVEHNGKTYAGQIMQIESTHLGVEDHGIVTAFLHCRTEGQGIGVGGFGLDRPVKVDGKFSHREGTGYGLDHIVQLVRTVGASSWEDCVGKHVIVLYEGYAGPGGMSAGIAGVTNGRVMVLKEHADQWRASHPAEFDDQVSE